MAHDSMLLNFQSIKLYWFILSSTSFDLGPELKDLINELAPASDRYYFIGIQLGISNEKLKIIKKDYPQETDMCFSEMLSYWLKNGVNISWKVVISALESPFVGHKTLAAGLREKYTTSQPGAATGRFSMTCIYTKLKLHGGHRACG